MKKKFNLYNRLSCAEEPTTTHLFRFWGGEAGIQVDIFKKEKKNGKRTKARIVLINYKNINYG